jgi:ABC-2 type transport system permease protein
MAKKYNQLQAMLAVTRASLIATFRSPQSLFFSLFFPIVLIWIFGALSGSGVASVDIGFERNTDTTNTIYQQIKHSPFIHVTDSTKKDIEDELVKGRIAAIVGIQKSQDSSKTPYILHLRSSSASQKDFALLESLLENTIHNIDEQTYPNRQTVAVVTQSIVTGRKYRMIDFFLPGMIGFSLIGSAVFGIAFSFFSFRETLVLKRMYSTPIRRLYIILGESISRVLFQLMTVVILIAFGYFAYHFTLAHGFITFFNMLILSALGLLVFMGFGFFFSGVAKNQNVIPIYANLFMFPQYFLSGTFFPRSSLPAGMQPFLKFLPLTALNDSMRNVAFEGLSLFSCWQEILIMIAWGVAIYIITAKVFRWE